MITAAGLLRRSIHRPFPDAVAACRAAIIAVGASTMASIDHAAAAKGAGLTLRPTTLLLFGNPAAGTHMMAARRESAIDLPLKLLVVAGEGGEVSVLAEDPQWVANRHGVPGELDAVVAGMREVMERVLDIVAA